GRTAGKAGRSAGRAGRGAGRAARSAAHGAGRAGRIAGQTAIGPARALTAVFRYWAAERATLRQGMASLSISAIGNIPTGLALGAMTGRLEALPGLFILIPAAIGMRGAIFGALGSRLGTSMHAGLLRFSSDRRGILMQNIYAATLLTFATSLFLAVVARAVTAATGLATISLWDFVVISVIGGVVSSAFVLVVTVWLAWVGSRRGWDLDSVAAPVITFVGDLITLPALFAASYLADLPTITLSVGVASALVCILAGAQAVRTDRPVARRILRESALTLALASVINLLAGTVIEHRIDRFLAFEALLVMLPSFLENAGALGGIVSSRLASKLHMGAIEPRVLPERLAALDISLAAPWSLLNFALTGISAHLVAVALGFASPGAAHMTGIALLAGAMATAGAALVAYLVAIATFRFSLDPDNHGIPAVTSAMDLVGVICVVGAVALIGVS
ncbi:MAG TPA: magnesium transporter, partial [Actinomycetota bacterium]